MFEAKVRAEEEMAELQKHQEYMLQQQQGMVDPNYPYYQDPNNPNAGVMYQDPNAPTPTPGAFPDPNMMHQVGKWILWNVT